MKQKLLKFFINFTLGFRFFFDNNIVYYLLKVSNNKEMIEKFRGKEFLVIGNGPSLKKTPLNQMKEMVNIGMNKINLLYEGNDYGWKPDMIVCVNGLVIQQNIEFFNSTETPLFFPVKAYYLGVKRRPNVYFFKQKRHLEFSDKITEGFGTGHTVTYVCFQLAAYLAAKKINIVGVDHSFKFQGTNKDISKMEGDDENHFHPDYFKGKLWGNPDLDGSERAYLKAKEYFDAHNVPVKDATIDGKLQVFDKIQIDELLKKK